MQTPFEGKLKYVLPLEAPDDIVDLEFVNPKFFMPAQAHPVYELTIFKGMCSSVLYILPIVTIFSKHPYLI